MQISDEKKINVLLSLLRERYEASHKMRERSLSFAIWILGFGVVISWMLLSGVTLTFLQKIIFTLFIAVIGFLTKRFLKAIERGFDRNRKIMIKIEDVLGCYDTNAYIENMPLFPLEYKNLPKKETSHFFSLYKWLLTMEVVLISLIWHDSIFKLLKWIIYRQ